MGYDSLPVTAFGLCSQRKSAAYRIFWSKHDWCYPFRCDLFDNILFEQPGDLNALKFPNFWNCLVWYREYKRCSRRKIDTLLCQNYSSSVDISHIWEFQHLDEFLSILGVVIQQVNFLSSISICSLWLWRLDLFMSLYFILSGFPLFVMRSGYGAVSLFRKSLHSVSSVSVLTA